MRVFTRQKYTAAMVKLATINGVTTVSEKLLMDDLFLIISNTGALNVLFFTRKPP